MEHLKKDHLLRRMIVASLGLLCIGIGIGFFLKANLGADTGSVFLLGISKVLGLNFGNTAALVNIAIILIVFIIDKRYINISSILAIFIMGYTAQASEAVLNALVPQDPSLFLRSILLLIGILIIGFNVPIYIGADLGVGAIDLPSEVISDKLHLNYRWVRIVTDLTYVGVGWILGGKVGVGTIIIALLLGPMIAFFRPFVNPRIQHFVTGEKLA